MHDPNAPIEGEYEHHPPAHQTPTQKARSRGWGTIAAGAAVIALKFKTLLLFLLNFKFVFLGLKLLSLSWTFLLSLGLYALAFGPKFAVVIVLLLAAHEFGHYFAYRVNGLPARLPVFVPFFGAYTAGAIAPELETDAYIALAGPLTGLGLAAVCYGIGVVTHDQFWYACADVSAFLNLFNMIPILPFDGGRAIGAISPTLWIAGAILFAVVAWYVHVPLVFIIILALLGIPAMLPALRGHVDPRAAAMTNGARFRVAAWYTVAAIGLVLVLGAAKSALPNNGGVW